MSAKPTAISTFAGCGGSSLGLRMAGFRELAEVEIDKHACATLRINFPEVHVVEADIHKVTAEQLLELAGLQPGELDLFDGSPPCQGFSTSGKRREDDSRNTLTFQYARLLGGLGAKVFVMENVTGLIKGKMARFYLEFVQQLREAGPGYVVKGAVMNAAHFGVPQRRERVIVIGVRKDLGVEPSHPNPTAQRMLTAAEAIADVRGEEHEADRAWMLEKCPRLSSFRDWAIVRPGGNLEDDGNTPGRGFGCIKGHPRRPIHTIPKNDGVIGMHGSMHWSERRRFTRAEYRRFFGYPDNFQFADVKAGPKIPAIERTWGQAVQRMGNSVPPPLMFAVAKHIRERILNAEPRTMTNGHIDARKAKRADGADSRKQPEARGRARRAAA